MKSKTSIAAFALVAGFATALPAAAQDSGIYVGASVGAARARNVCTNATKCDDDETGFRGFAGYQVNKYLAAEAGLQYFTMFGRNSQGISTHALDLLAVGSFPVLAELSLQGKAGAYFASMKSAPNGEDKAGFTYGVGAQYEATKELAWRLDWQRYDNVGGGNLGFNTDIDVLSIGLVWRLR